MKVFYRVQFKPKGKRTWRDTSWGSLTPEEHFVELSHSAALQGKKDAEVTSYHYQGKFRIVRITQTIEEVR